ncbi:hypothetical protein WMQ59_17890 [Vibrio diabolicus]|uniref:hypothetical protein n=1 Tax=Vibrio TaxID=662 RepID=UPI00215EB447|nr:hypothetical protein [Vibrio diabolicus]MCS0364941.1 hypothetical protein [Vibrio diabolicus]
MSKSLLTSEYIGTKNRVVHCKGAIKTYEQSLTKVQSGKRRSLTRQLILQIERLARGERMSSQNFAAEAALPNASGGKKFYALKKIPIRGYCWQSSNRPSTYYISHYISKDFQKLRDKDTQIVHNNWTRVEVHGDEC